MVETSISPQTLSLKDRIVDVRNRTVAKLAQYKGILKAATLTAAALLTTASSCDGTPSANIGDINAGVGGAGLSGECVTIHSGGANIRTSAATIDDLYHPANNVAFWAQGGARYPYMGSETGGIADATGSTGKTWYRLDVNQDGLPDDYVHSSVATTGSCN